MKFRPCIDLHNGKVKQIVGGSLNDQGQGIIENFVSDQSSSYYAELFKRDALTGGHIIMLGQGNETAAMEALNTYEGGLQIGGGITPDNAKNYLNAGATHVIVTSFLFEGAHFVLDKLKALEKVVGKKNLVVDLSCRKQQNAFYVVTNRWQTFTDFELNPRNQEVLSQYCDEFLIHGVDVEGLKQGIEYDLVEKLAQESPLQVTYAGGIRHFEDIELIQKIGHNKLDFTVGSALNIFGGQVDYQQVVEFTKRLDSKY